MYGKKKNELVAYLSRSGFVKGPRDCPSSRLKPMDEFLHSPIFHLALL